MLGQEIGSVGERIAWYRRRRGLSQEVLAGLVGRSTDWLSKVENGRITLDRLSVLKSLSDVLGVRLDELIGTALAAPAERWDSEAATVPLRDALSDYGRTVPLVDGLRVNHVPDLDALAGAVADAWTSYQQGRFLAAAYPLPRLLAEAHAAISECRDDAQQRALSLLALTYQSAAMVLTKLGERDLAWLAADRGLAAARSSQSMITVGSLTRSVAHCLLSKDRYADALRVVHDGADNLEPARSDAPVHASLLGTLLLTGSVAASRSGDRRLANELLRRADATAHRLGKDANHMWTAFGPTNVAIHRVSAAMELGDAQIAIDQGVSLDASPLPVERQVRHALEVARAYSARNRTPEAVAAVLEAEQKAPEQVRSHFIARQLVTRWVRTSRGKPSFQLAGLAKRVRVLT
jgi:transcriptional regulator with XRE-family HTH domain